MKRRNSLRARLTVWFTALLILFGALGGLGAYIAAQQDPDNFLDDQMREVALDVVGSVDDLAQMPAPPLDASDAIVVQAWDADGRLLKSFPPGYDLPRQAKTGFSTFDTPTERWRSYTWVLDDGTVQVSQQAVVRRALALKAALPAIITTFLLIPMSWLLVRWLVGRVLDPVDGLADQLLARRPDSTQPLAAPDVPREIVPLVGAMNAAFARAGDALAAQRRFVSNAAHQLRTPLTALRIQLRNLRQVSGGAEAAEVLEEMEIGLRRMSTLTGQLLALARAESLAPMEAHHPSCLIEAVREAVAGVVPLAESKGITLTAAWIPRIPIKAGRDDLTMLLSNLLDNAIRYTPPGGRVGISVRSDDRHATIEIADTGPGIPVDMLPRVFDPFVRANTEHEGTGLGLSIVKALAARIDAQVRLRNREDGSGLVAQVVLPIASTRERQGHAPADAMSPIAGTRGRTAEDP
ncbi:sensor histidine kinase [Microvirga subterranea]|uniref:histidine kinase n=1 Tax=Microvirga subterranea TaxID=186651 RepID=A0A370HIE2_9HYPH|nr:ATP-binding protein [Microvirga subterranea]RDI57967.1 two-component system OmpR family sensor kinase [Microvirga subterranea]